MNTLELLAACVTELTERMEMLTTRVTPIGVDAFTFERVQCEEGIEIGTLIVECFKSLGGKRDAR